MKRAGSPAMFALVVLVAGIGGAGWWATRSREDAVSRARDARPERDDAMPSPAGAAAADATPDAERALEQTSPPQTPISDDVDEAAPRSILLHVFESGHAEELKDVEVFASKGGLIERKRSAAAVTPDGPLLVRGDAPLRVEPAEDALDVEMLIVRARGLLPGVVFVHWPGGGERDVELERPCALDVHVIGAPADAMASAVLVRIEDARTQEAIEALQERMKPTEPAFALSLVRILERVRSLRVAPLQGGVFATFEEMPPGDWCVRVGLDAGRGDLEWPPRGIALVSLESGQRLRVDLDWAGLRKQAIAPLAGTLVVPGDWPDDDDRVQNELVLPENLLGTLDSGTIAELKRAQIRARKQRYLWIGLEGLDEDWRRGSHASMQRDESATGQVWRWQSPVGELGPLVARAHDWHVEIPFEARSGRASEIELRVPSRAELFVTLVDAMTGEPFEDGRMSCRVRPAGDGVRCAETALQWDVRARCFQAVLPAAAAEVVLDVPSFERFATMGVDLRPGRNDVVLRAQCSADVRITLRAGEGEDAPIVPWEPLFRARFEQQGRIIPILRSDSASLDPAAEMTLAGSGPMVLRIDGIPGLAAEPLALDVAPAAMTVVEIPLRRAR